MKGYPEYYTIIYRNDQRIVILNENPEKRVAPPKKSIDSSGNVGIGTQITAPLKTFAALMY